MTSDQKHTNHIATGQFVSRLTSRPEVFYSFSNAHFLKTTFTSRTISTFAKPHKPTHIPSFAKELFFANARTNNKTFMCKFDEKIRQ